MSDIVQELLFRSSDKEGVGWLPTTVVHVPAGLLHNASDEITRLRAEVERLKAALRQIAGIDTWDDNEQGYVDKAPAALGDTHE